MDLPRGQSGERAWIDHVLRFKNYPGTKAAYCRLHNLDYNKFIYYSSPRSAQRAETKVINKAGFARVETVGSEAGAKSYPQLPDPKWLAEFIHSMVKSR